MKKLTTLFFHVLNSPTELRSKSLADLQNIPYLNSGLFQITYLETLYGRISGLRNDLTMPVFKNSVLNINKKELSPLEYLLLFLDEYNFGVPEKQEVQHKTKDLINASVLGKIFEKLLAKSLTCSFCFTFFFIKQFRSIQIKFNKKKGKN